MQRRLGRAAPPLYSSQECSQSPALLSAQVKLAPALKWTPTDLAAMAEKRSPYGVQDVLAARARVKEVHRGLVPRVPPVPSPPARAHPRQAFTSPSPLLDPPDLHQPRQPHLSLGTACVGGPGDVCGLVSQKHVDETS